MNWHETSVDLLVVHLLDRLEGCDFEPWLAMSSSFSRLVFLPIGGKLRNFKNSLRN